MHFGRLKSSADADHLDFHLPPDAERTKKFLALPHPETVAKHIYAGAPIWGVKEWIGNVYPQGAKSSDFLKLYAERYDAIELNSTFYHLLDGERIAHWRDAVPKSFRFCPKLYRGITEALTSSDLPKLVEAYCASIAHFKDRLGMCFAQLPETFSPRGLDVLARFLTLWPKSIQLAVEFRHRGWFEDHHLLDVAVNMLYRQGASAVITDTFGRRDALHTSLMSRRVMVRFLGTEGHPSDKARLAEWATRAREWVGQQVDEIYIFCHQPSEVLIPQTVDTLKVLLH